MNKKFEIKDGDISDGYHTFDELYDHRVTLYLAFILNTSFPCYLINDHYEGWDAVYLILPDGQISYHIPSKYRHLLKDRASESPRDFEWDGHTGNDVLYRIRQTL